MGVDRCRRLVNNERMVLLALQYKSYDRDIYVL